MLAVDDALERLGTRPTGLNADEAAARLRQHGPNELQSLERTNAWRTLVSQFRNVLILILLAATLVSALLGHTLEALVITVIVLFAVLLGFVQEYRASRALEALRSMAAPFAHVLRDGAEAQVPARDLVPGDIVSLRAGDRVPADARLILESNLAIDESALTGESIAVEKSGATLDDAGRPLAERHNMVHAGTLTARGHGRAVVVATGMSTEFGHISGLVQGVESGRTPLQENLDRLGATLGKAALAVVVLIVVLGLWRGLPALDLFMFGIALAVAVVPEALPAVVTISLAIGVRRMVRRNALVRRLPIVETLGSTSVICTDKTGTLTRNEMTVRRIFVDERLVEVSGAGYEPAGDFRVDGLAAPPSPTLLELLRAGVLSSDARLVDADGRWTVDGDPTEGALVVAARKADLAEDQLRGQAPRVRELAFTSERRRMTTIHDIGDGLIAYSKGAADVVLADCATQLRDEVEVQLDEEDRQRFRDSELRLAGEGL
ncbi:MAG TPA: HAD-IC family P-type ATPase, partial [Burkholderiaceae bacterium]|nr:HAD-IC family P-type ATPase [Burkholderiaceae bacterium]